MEYLLIFCCENSYEVHFIFSSFKKKNSRNLNLMNDKPRKQKQLPRGDL